MAVGSSGKIKREGIDDQGNVLVFLREVGAVDNRVYRQFARCDTLKASAELSMMRDAGLLKMKDWGKATY